MAAKCWHGTGLPARRKWGRLSIGGAKASEGVKEGSQGSDSNLRSARVEKKTAQGTVVIDLEFKFKVVPSLVLREEVRIRILSHKEGLASAGGILRVQALAVHIAQL